jgi:hypothetical protein
VIGHAQTSNGRIPMKNPIRKIAGMLFAVVATGSIILNLYLWTYYTHTRPTRPVQSTGQVIPLNNHGAIVFLNKKEDRLMMLTWYGGLMLWILAAITFGDLDGRAKAWKAYRAAVESKEPKTLAERLRAGSRLDL